MLTKNILIVLLKLPLLLGSIIKRDAAYQRWPKFDGRMWDKNWLLFQIESASLIHCSALCKSHRLCENYFYNEDKRICTGGHLRVVINDIEQFGHEEGSALYLEFPTEGQTPLPKATSPVGLEASSSRVTVATLASGETSEAPMNETSTHDVPKDETATHEAPTDKTATHEAPADKSATHEAPVDETSTHDVQDLEELIKISSPPTTDIADISQPPFITTTETSEVKYKSTEVGTGVATSEMTGPKYYTIHNVDMEGGQAMCEEMTPTGHLVWIEDVAENGVVWKLLNDKGIRQAYIGSIWDPDHKSILYYPSRETTTFHGHLFPLVDLATDNNTVHCVSMRIEELFWFVGRCDLTLDCVCEQ